MFISGLALPTISQGTKLKAQAVQYDRVYKACDFSAAADREHRPITYEQQLLRNHIDHSELYRQPLLS